MTRQVPRIGFHAPIAGGLQNALLIARELGCDAVQIFSRNPRGWMARPLADEEVAAFKRARRQTRISPVVIHTNYLINLAGADEHILEASRASFREELLRAMRLGAEYLIVHPGSSRGDGEEEGIARCIESLRAACDGIEPRRTRILLENTAGQGNCIGHRFEHLREIIRGCRGLKLGVCLDTAHAFAAGYDIRDAHGLAAMFETIDRTVGFRRVRAVHFNDSRAAYNSRVDRHWHIGQGQIGAGPLRSVACHPGLAHAAFVLETPYRRPEENLPNILALRSFVGRG